MTIDECLSELLAQLTEKRSDNKLKVLEPSTIRLLAAINGAAARNHIATDYNPLLKKPQESSGLSKDQSKDVKSKD